MKITPESMKKQYEDLWNTFCKKNHDYGSSFEQSLDKHGLIAGVVRMEDKMNRISTLVDGNKHAEVASESLADTLRDLSNYSAMVACWLDGPDDVKELVAEQINSSREVANGVKEVESTEKHQPLSVELKGLENGYVIRQHINSHNSWRYTIAFNPEGTIKVEGDVEKPYVIECFSYTDGDSNTWALHVFDTREDMVAALNYDLKISKSNESINFGDSIKGLDIKVSVFSDFTLEVLETWVDTFGLAFNNQMLSKGLRTEESIQLYHGIKMFGPVFISEKTGALIIKGTIREDSVKRPCDFIWFGDTKEVLLEVDNTIPKFNSNGIIYGVVYENNKYVRYFNQLYDSMAGKIMYKFNSWDESKLKNLVFFNEDEGLEPNKHIEFNPLYQTMDKKFQIPNDSPSANAKNTVGLDNFGALESCNLSSKKMVN